MPSPDSVTPRAAVLLLARFGARPATWCDRAVCAEVDPELFFPDKGEPSRPAKQVCAVCEVRAYCLQEALDRREHFGVWGGLSERERRVLLARPVPARSCPEHGYVLSGGPAVYRCPAGPRGHLITGDSLAAAAGPYRDAA
jgi:WhiB family redox-sensing transcriptional regulator